MDKHNDIRLDIELAGNPKVLDVVNPSVKSIAFFRCAVRVAPQSPYVDVYFLANSRKNYEIGFNTIKAAFRLVGRDPSEIDFDQFAHVADLRLTEQFTARRADQA